MRKEIEYKLHLEFQRLYSETKEGQVYPEHCPKWVIDYLSSLPPQSPSLVSEEEIEAMAVANHPDGMRGLGFIEGFKKCLLLVKEGEKDADDLALKFSQWIMDEMTEGNLKHYDGDNYWWYFKNTKPDSRKITKMQLLQIFKQEQQKTGNNG